MISTPKDLEAMTKAVKDRLDRPIVLVGMMGSGKSHAGTLLAQALGLDFADSDKKIEEAAGCSVQEIFQRDGETKFRASEKRVVSELLGSGIMVLATGGGAIMDMDTAASIREKAVSIWIDVDIDELLKRIKDKGGRPLLMGDNPKKVLENLLKERRPAYEKADITVRGEGLAVAQLVDRMVDALHEFLCGDGRP
ncbi:MAG: shikimate kinase [Micavibrio sp.]|nr:MAG: shikimate kinase [Micavibrio sp.]